MSIYNNKKPSLNFYVYAYLRKSDNSPYYNGRAIPITIYGIYYECKKCAMKSLNIGERRLNTLLKKEKVMK